jgi:hypothetical protein
MQMVQGEHKRSDVSVGCVDVYEPSGQEARVVLHIGGSLLSSRSPLSLKVPAGQAFQYCKRLEPVSPRRPENRVGSQWQLASTARQVAVSITMWHARSVVVVAAAASHCPA